MVYVQFTTYKVQQIACNKICKQISHFFGHSWLWQQIEFTLLTSGLFLYTHLLTVLQYCICVLPDTSIEKENDRQWTNTLVQKDKTTMVCAARRDLLEGFERRGSPDHRCRTAFAWSKLNTLYWTFTVLHLTVESGWHAFYNQALLTKRTDKFLPQRVSLCPSDNENNCGELDARANRWYEVCPLQLAHLDSYYTHKIVFFYYCSL